MVLAIRRLAASIAAAIALAFPCCVATEPSSSFPIPPLTSSASVRTKVVLVTIDGVRWQDVFLGPDAALGSEPASPRTVLPELHKRFVDAGAVFGRRSLVVVSGPAHVSVPGYLEMMRARSTYDCFDNACDPKLGTTLVDRFGDAAVFSSWTPICRVATASPANVAMNCGRQRRTERWRSAALPDDTEFLPTHGDDYRPDALTMLAVDRYLERHGQPDLLWVSLGDTDEWAHEGDYASYWKALRAADAFVGRLVDRCDEDTVFLVTTDHGRASNWRNHGFEPQSARVWVMLRGMAVVSRGFAKLEEPASLSDVAPSLLHLSGRSEELGRLR